MQQDLKATLYRAPAYLAKASSVVADVHSGLRSRGVARYGSTAAFRQSYRPACRKSEDIFYRGGNTTCTPSFTRGEVEAGASCRNLHYRHQCKNEVCSVVIAMVGSDVVPEKPVDMDVSIGLLFLDVGVGGKDLEASSGCGDEGLEVVRGWRREKKASEP